MPGLLTARELRERRATMAEQANAILAAPAGENGNLSDEQRTQFDAIHADIEALGADVRRIEQHEETQRQLDEVIDTRAGGRERGGDAPTDEQRAQQQYLDAFGAYLRHGVEGLSAEQRTILQANFRPGTEGRAAQTVTTSGGGYLIPQGFSGQLEESMLAFGGVENVADVFSTESGNPLPWPTVDDTANSGRLLAINTQATQTGVTYGVKTFGAYKFSSDVVLVPVELLQDSAFDLNAHLTSVLATRLGRVRNTYQTTGTGSSQPQGIVVGASSGVTAAAAAAVTYDELIDLEHSVDPAYRNPAFGPGWMFKDSTLKILRKLKDGDGRPLWQAGLTQGAPDTLNGYPYQVNQDMDAMTTGLKPILFGAMKKFKVRKVAGITLLRLVERYADYHQIGFLAFTRWDSQVLDAGTDPLKYITMA